MRLPAAVLLLVLALLPAASAWEGPLAPAVGRLPHGLADAAFAGDGEAAYLFGGMLHEEGRDPAATDAILRVDLATFAVRTLEARLPEPRAHLAAAWTPHGIHVFGGDLVLRFDSRTERLETLDARLPEPRRGMPAVWDGARILLVGGDGCVNEHGAVTACDDVLAFDPATGAVERLAARLPARVTGSAAAMLDGRLHVFGGDGLGQRVLALEAGDDAFVDAGELEPGTRGLTAVAVGDEVLLFGGGFDAFCAEAGTCRAVRRVDAHGTVTLADVGTPARGKPAAVARGDEVVLMGGEAWLTGGYGHSDEILLWSPRPPQEPARETPGPGALALLGASAAALLAARRPEPKASSPEPRQEEA